MYDFIGDIHGHADKLCELLEKLGYSKKNGIYQHSERKVFFLGDYIDRGKQIKETLFLVRNMVESGSALAIMGNHEYNAVMFYYPEKEGGHLRKHEIKNIIQHFETLKAFENNQAEYESWLDWFLTLPLYHETEKFRAVHACWDHKRIEFLRNNLIDNKLTSELVYESAVSESEMYFAIEDTLKGKELTIPDNIIYKDKNGFQRKEIRIKWWEDMSTATYKSISVEKIDHLPDVKIPDNLIITDYYGENEKPVFFGHYWLHLNTNPGFFKKNICCLDYSIAKHGQLAAYRFDGEQTLDWQKVVMV